MHVPKNQMLTARNVRSGSSASQAELLLAGQSRHAARCERKKMPQDEIATAIARCAGCLADSVATGESIDSGEGRAIHYGGSSKSSSTGEHELRCFGRSRRSPAFTWCEVMRIVVLRETPVPGRASRRRRSVHVSHSCFAGLQRRSPFSSQLPVETRVLPFCSSHWSHK